MLIIGNAFALTSYWGLSDDRLVRQLLPAAVAGIVFGTFLLHGLPANGLRLSLAGFSLLIVTYRFVGATLKPLRYQPPPWHAAATGAVEGLASSLDNAGGPAPRRLKNASGSSAVDVRGHHRNLLRHHELSQAARSLSDRVDQRAAAGHLLVSAGTYIGGQLARTPADRSHQPGGFRVAGHGHAGAVQRPADLEKPLK
ncbi:MAG: sulfite exporter TauE/SafE family protein [Burkholderiaceae bacterium]